MRNTALVAAMFVLGLGAGLLTATASTGPATVRTAKIGSLGTIIVSSTGRTLYHDSAETAGHVKCLAACATLWPPLVIPAGAKPTAGPGVSRALLGTVKRPDGRIQVTYHGMALYLYAKDPEAGDAKGQGAGGIWYAITPAGRVVTKNATAGTTTTTTPLGSSGSTTTTIATTTTAITTTTPSTEPVDTTTTSDTSTDDCATNPGGYGCM